MSTLTHLLQQAASGERKAAEELLPQVYEELRKLAASKMAAQFSGHTLQPTALVHEAWLRLTQTDNSQFEGRTHFFAAAAEAMRHILIDRARRRQALRHGAGAGHVELDGLEIAGATPDDEMLAVNEALEKFAAEEPQKVELVKLRYFVGMTIEQSAEVLGISEATAKRHWAYARAWLFDELQNPK